MPITMAHAGSPGLVGGAAFGGSLMRNRRKYGVQAAQFADRAIQRRDQRLKYALDRRDRLADRQDRIQLSLMGQAAADARQQAANNLRRELAVGDATTRFMLANQADERARLTQQGYSDRQEDQQAFLEQQQIQKAQAARDEAVFEGLSSGEWELPETAPAELKKLENDRVTIANDKTLSPEKRQKAFEEIEARRLALLRTARPAMSDPAARRNRELGYFNPATGKFQNEYSEGVIPFLGDNPLKIGSEGQTPTDRVIELTEQFAAEEDDRGNPIGPSEGRKKAEKLVREQNLIRRNLPPSDDINAKLARIKGDRAEDTAKRWWQAVEDGKQPTGDDMTPGRLWRLHENKIIDLTRTPELAKTVHDGIKDDPRVRGQMSSVDWNSYSKAMPENATAITALRDAVGKLGNPEATKAAQVILEVAMRSASEDSLPNNLVRLFDAAQDTLHRLKVDFDAIITKAKKSKKKPPKPIDVWSHFGSLGSID